MMNYLMIILFTMLCIFNTANIDKAAPSVIMNSVKLSIQKKDTLSAMEALDLVKERYADNFVKIDIEGTEDYYYKLLPYDYYLCYEGLDENEEYYMIHLYEFVLDEPEIGIGHTVTYGWYSVDINTGEIKE